MFPEIKVAAQLRKASVRDNSPRVKPTGIHLHVEVYKQL
ncbi:Hypothetical protein PHPALM_14384 [Phytophthora palmivora]|uniref:Uncharacterized protein n=1 Tax=Phytophthora palmivora TaxID=4796 RepID=A0A2P4XUV9_9STRA|nr:Hypothetical protein PHPALM_14384 [Phytophthora palmivora]